MEELQKAFEPVKTSFFPLHVPIPNINLAAGMRLQKKRKQK
jgi:hypothetical protein